MITKNYIPKKITDTCTKVKYRNRKDAKDAIFYQTRNGELHTHFLFYYWCKYCQHWHLTSHPWVGTAPVKRAELKKMYQKIHIRDLPELNRNIAP